LYHFTSETQLQLWGVEVSEENVAVGEAFWGKEPMKMFLFTHVSKVSGARGMNRVSL